MRALILLILFINLCFPIFSQEEIVQIPGFVYLKTQNYSCGGVTNTVAEYTHRKTMIQFILIPGGVLYTRNDSLEVLSFLISKHEITQRVWTKIMHNNPSRFKGDDNPVENVSWKKIQKFCQKTNLRLPTETEWEYACRAKTKTFFYWGDLPPGPISRHLVDKHCWYQHNSKNKTHPVGRKKANAFGLHDMIGNVYEWCEDEGTLPGKIQITKSRKNIKVVRGGCFLNAHVKDCHPGKRAFMPESKSTEYIGFRVCHSIKK